MCHAICPITTCEENYIGETARHRHERIKDHNGRDHKSHIKSHIIIALKNAMIMWLKKTLKSLLRTLEITNKNEKYQNHSG